MNPGKGATDAKAEARRLRIGAAFAVLDESYAEHQPRRCFTLFSGGHDSTTASALAFDWARARDIPLTAALIDTTIAVPEAHEHVRAICRAQDWPLVVLRPPRTYESLVLEYGFPGPGFHGRFAYPRLKARAIEQLVRDTKELWKDRVMLVTGIRKEESIEREAQVTPVDRDGAQLWTAPIWDWKKIQCAHEMRLRGLPRNPVSDTIHISGDCLCGAKARKHEIEEIRGWFPHVADVILDLQRRVQATGHPASVWGVRPPNVSRHQMRMDLDLLGPLCRTCATDDLAEAA